MVVGHAEVKLPEMPTSVIGRVAAAATVYAIALALAVAVACATLGFSCSGGATPVASALLAAAALFATGLVVNGALVTPAALLLRRVGWLFWWTFLAVAVAAAAAPVAALCLFSGECSQSGFAPLAVSILFAGLCAAALLWGSWLRHSASRSTAAISVGAAFLGAYVAALLAAVIYVAASRGDMAGMIFFYLALPWAQMGVDGLLAGLALNAGIAFGVGYGVSRIASR
jgi:hypothetical protein